MLIVNIFVDSKYIIPPGGYVNFIDNLRTWIQGHPSRACGIFLTTLFIILLVVIRTQYQNPVMNVKLKITRFCNWLQSLRLYFWLEVSR